MHFEHATKHNDGGGSKISTCTNEPLMKKERKVRVLGYNRLLLYFALQLTVILPTPHTSVMHPHKECNTV
jgi:hypothetical protein